MVTADSRRIKPGALFAALPGSAVDGHAYLEDAIGRGCAAVLVGRGHKRPLKRGARAAAAKPAGVAWIEVDDPSEAFGRLCASFQGHPAAGMTMIAITGTNGKTTSAYLLEAMIRRAGGNPGVIGTVNYRFNDRLQSASHTTPEPETLQGLLREMADGGVTHVIMEVSSHALEQKRVAGLRFDAALFTNLSREHLDYHREMEAYYAAKKRLFTDHLKPGGAAVVVAGAADEEDWSRRLAAELRPLATGAAPALRLLRCGGEAGDLTVRRVREDLAGLRAELGGPLGELALRSELVGEFNLRNLLGVAGIGLALGLTPENVAEGLAAAPPPPGRLEKIPSARGITVFVDYAHTPDALAKVLAAMRRLTSGRLIVIFGCGGDRDAGKRPLMGEVAGRLADIVILTSDNPRSESPAAILAAIEPGLERAGVGRCRLEALLAGGISRKGYDLVVSRRQAIRDTIFHARVGDVILICGKGHETSQIIGDQRRFFDDRLEAAEQLAVAPY